ncbi:MAG: hypothetical protein P4L56_08210 [Candidatus Sulfopaludibacter sp.]|nr:hypothetical protein [Candidatus Sulfopaludibacter sp.]
MKIRLAVVALSALVLLAVGSPAMGQTTYNLPDNPNGKVDFIDYGTYANLFDSEMPVTINGVPFLVSITAHMMPDETIYTPYSSIEFWNQQTGETVNVPLTGTISSYAYTLNHVGPTIKGSFSGSGYNGSFVLNLLPHHPCKVGRFCYLIYWGQVNSTLTLN